MDNINWLLPDEDELRRVVVNMAMENDISAELILWAETHNCQFGGSRERYGSDWDYLEKKEPKLLQETILGFAQQYNHLVEDFSRTHPLSAGRIWAIYCSTGIIFRSESYFSEMFKTLSDSEFSMLYCYHQVSVSGRAFSDSPDFDFGKGLQTEYDSDFLSGIGKYKFTDRDKQVKESIWDLRQRRLPLFVYRKSNHN